MLRILIIEDEKWVAKDLEKTILQVIDYQLVGVMDSVKNAVCFLENNSEPDLIFMDIHLADGLSFEIFNHVKIQSPVIFTTAYDQYALQAFKVNSIDYLLKPVDKNELKQAIDKFKNLTKQDLNEKLQNIINNWTKNSYKERILVQTRQGFMPIPCEKIAYFQKEELVYLVTYQNEKYICETQKLEELENQLNPQYFFRLNRQFIVRVDAVSQFYSNYKGLVVQLKQPLNLEIQVSREKANEFKNWII